MLVVCLVSFLASCAPHEEVRGLSAAQSIDLPKVSFAVLAETTEGVMERRGFLAAPAFTPGSPTLRKPVGGILRFVGGGQPEVWFVAEPTASGWQLTARPQTDPLFPHAAVPRYDNVLREISRKLSGPQTL